MLVNAAAILQVIPVAEVDPEAFRRHFTVNVEAVWFLCRDVGAAMADGGAIVNFSSPSARWAYTLETAVYGHEDSDPGRHPELRHPSRPPRHPGQRHLAGHRGHAHAGAGPEGGVAPARAVLRGPELLAHQPRATRPVSATRGDGVRGRLPPVGHCRLHHRPDHLRRRRLHHVRRSRSDCSIRGSAEPGSPGPQRDTLPPPERTSPSST